MADFEIRLLLHRLRNTGKREIVAISENLQKFTEQSGLQYISDKTIDEIISIDEYEAKLRGESDKIRAPSFLSKEQKKLFKGIIDYLMPSGILGILMFML